MNGANTNRTPGDAAWTTIGALAGFSAVFRDVGSSKKKSLLSKKLESLFVRTSRLTSSII